jgi:hypothetical protein
MTFRQADWMIPVGLIGLAVGLPLTIVLIDEMGVPEERAEAFVRDKHIDPGVEVHTHVPISCGDGCSTFVDYTTLAIPTYVLEIILDDKPRSITVDKDQYDRLETTQTVTVSYIRGRLSSEPDIQRIIEASR